MALLITGIVRVLVVAVMTWLASKGAFTSNQWQPYTDVIVNGIVLGLTMVGAVLWHYLEAEYQKTENIKKGAAIAGGYDPTPTVSSTSFSSVPTSGKVVPVADAAKNITIQPSTQNTKNQ